MTVDRVIPRGNGALLFDYTFFGNTLQNIVLMKTLGITYDKSTTNQMEKVLFRQNKQIKQDKRDDIIRAITAYNVLRVTFSMIGHYNKAYDLHLICTYHLKGNIVFNQRRFAITCQYLFSNLLYFEVNLLLDTCK